MSIVHKFLGDVITFFLPYWRLTTSNATKVNIQISKINHQITIDIQDNGIGFELTNVKETGNEMHYIQKKMKRINGTIHKTSTRGIGTMNIIKFQVISNG